MMKVAGNVDAPPSATSGFSPVGESSVFRYGIAVLSVVASTSLAVLTSTLGVAPRGQAAIFFFGIAVAVWYGGTGPAIVAVVLSGLAYDYFFVEPIYSFGLGRADVPHFVLFILFAFLVAWFTSVRRKVE